MNTLKVTDVMTSLVVTVRPDHSLQEAALLMASNGISGAPVIEGRRLLGVVSEADIVRAYAPPASRGSAFLPNHPLMVLLRGDGQKNVDGVKVRDIMNPDVVSISPDASVWQAASLIDAHGVRRLPVIDGSSLVGIVTRSDIVRAMARSDEEVAASIREAIAVLDEECFESLKVVVEDGVVSIEGIADRRSTKEIALGVSRQVPGVIEVIDALNWELDDKRPALIGQARSGAVDPWAVGALVKEG